MEFQGMDEGAGYELVGLTRSASTSNERHGL
jgi:hypothetical protein